ncbi:sigma-70 family RNA polymerase sigma factor [Azomonas macrocytogenes]|uniref:RNA polymerase sigma factor n=1 Tax=Azomonas macrocytogenes TaxID=69962 RepID=A0A839TBW2_AZOMA|nr:RNA polymerase sigma-70 factor (ECF subfamily) [Azomonas macrocytogenes]
MISDQPDNTFARLAAHGDQHAFSLLVQRHSPALAQAARSFGIPETDIDDIVQDTFIAAWRALDEYDETRSFRSWLFRIGLNKMRDLWRSRKVRSFLFGAIELESSDTLQVADLGSDLERNSIAQRELVRVVSLLNELDRDLREALVLTAIVGMSQVEAAAASGTTVKAIEGRVLRARAKLAAILDQCG